MSSIPSSRRRFLAVAAAGIAGACLFTQTRLARADDLPHLAEADATAAALGYREDATKVDAAKYPQYKKEQNCLSCRFYQGAAGFGPCQLFPAKAVAAKGWCGGYNAKT